MTYLILALCFCVPAIGSDTPQEGKAAPKNIILFIGDGMSLGHVTAVKVCKEIMWLDRFPIAGFLMTPTKDNFITNSSLSGTSMATGHVTKYEYIAISHSKEPLKTVLEYAEEKGMATGIVVTSRITDATPACFFAHVDSRFKEAQIAEALTKSGVDVAFGGGLGFFLPAHMDNSLRKDEKNLLREMKKRYDVALDTKEFFRLGASQKAVALLAQRDLPFAREREISLAQMTRKAIEILSTNRNGFFLMAEASHVDWYAHRGDSENIIKEMIDLDDAMGVAYEFARKSGDTLVLLTSDHDTGGYFISAGSLEKKKIKMAACAVSGHTANMVPLFAYGPGSEVFGGIHDMPFIGKTLIRYITGSPPKQK